MKIDASFVHRIETGSPEIVDAIIALAHTLKLEVTAEGIETEQQLAHLTRAGCSTGQGFYFSNAVPAETAQHMVQQERQWSIRRSAGKCTLGVQFWLIEMLRDEDYPFTRSI